MTSLILVDYVTRVIYFSVLFVLIIFILCLVSNVAHVIYFWWPFTIQTWLLNTITEKQPTIGSNLSCDFWGGQTIKYRRQTSYGKNSHWCGHKTQNKDNQNK
jgi:hypothetical protein